MKTLKFLSLMFIAFVFIVGCAGNYGIFKSQTRSESKTIKKQLIHNWSDYDIWYYYHPVYKYKPLPIIIIIFDTKNDHIKILAPGNFNKVNDQEMEYTIYYSFRSDPRPSAIMFDSKNNDKKLVGDNWYKIEDQNTLSETISIIQQQYDHCHVDIIEGPDNQVYGYMYYPHWLNLPVKVVDERTLYVSTLPPYRSAP